MSTVNEIFLDVETLHHSDEVSDAWTNLRSFGISVAVTYDATRGFRTWFESDARDLIRDLASFDRIITFNGERFAFKVLEFYAPVQRLHERSVDLCELVCSLNHGFRCSLNQLAKENLHRGKRSFSHPRYRGLGAPELWRIGETERVIRYCRNDVQLLVDLKLYIRAHGFLTVHGHRLAIPSNFAHEANTTRAHSGAVPVTAKPSSAPASNVSCWFWIGFRAARARHRVISLFRSLFHP